MKVVAAIVQVIVTKVASLVMVVMGVAKMPRKYNPIYKVEYGRGYGSDYTYATMEESKYCEWVPLKVFEDETNRLNAVILKLKKQLNKLYFEG
jgi:hypothetical protein